MSKLQRLIDWAEENNIDIDKSQVDGGHNTVGFWQNRHTRKEFQRVKKAVGMFERKGNPPYVHLEQTVFVESMVNGEYHSDQWQFKWQGAYECKSLGYDCGQADFAPEPEPEELDNMVEEAIEASRQNT